jgi:lysozyme family protein
MGFLDRLSKILADYDASRGRQPESVSTVTTPQEKEESHFTDSKQIFQKGLDFVLASEGGYVNDHYDPGGETKYGISKKAYPHLDIANLTLEDAKTIYYRDYWLGSGAKVVDYSPELAMILFDTAVNMGTGTALKFLQRTLRVKEDGVFGEETQAALEKSNIEEVIQWYMTNRVMRYSDLETWSRYRRGWIKRVMSLMRYV